MALKRDGDAAQALWRLSGIGIELIAMIIAFLLLGWLLDRWWGTRPWALLVCVVVGVFGGLYKAVQQARAAGAAAEERYRREHSNGAQDGG